MTTTTSHIPRTTEEAFTIAKTAAIRLRTLGAIRIVLWIRIAADKLEKIRRQPIIKP